MRTAGAALLSWLLAACSEVVVEPAPDGGGGGIGGQLATTGSSSSSGGAGAGPNEGGASSGGSAGVGGAPTAIPACASPDTFDSGVLDAQWSAFPTGSFALVDGAVELHGDLAYLKLHTQPASCAFSFDLVSLTGGRVSLQIVGEADALIDVRVENGAVSAVSWDPIADNVVVVGSPVPGTPLGLALVFLEGQISCAARYESGWYVLATFASPDWFDDEEPEVRFVDMIDGGSARIDDYGVQPVDLRSAQTP